MTEPLLLIKFPTRGRFERFFQTLELYLRLADPAVRTFVLMSFDQDDATMPEARVSAALRTRMGAYPGVRGKAVWGAPVGKIGAINRDMQLVESLPWTTLLLASDDMLPELQGYNRRIVADMAKHYPDGDGVLWYNDGHRGADLNTLVVEGRPYYNRFGYIYHPKYKSLWCDNHFMDVANILGRQKKFDDVIIRHHHPAYDAHVKKDATYAQNDRHYRADMETYQAMKARGFDLHVARAGV